MFWQDVHSSHIYFGWDVPKPSRGRSIKKYVPLLYQKALKYLRSYLWHLALLTGDSVNYVSWLGPQLSQKRFGYIHVLHWYLTPVIDPLTLCEELLDVISACVCKNPINLNIDSKNEPRMSQVYGLLSCLVTYHQVSIGWLIVTCDDILSVLAGSRASQLFIQWLNLDRAFSIILLHAADLSYA